MEWYKEYAAVNSGGASTTDGNKWLLDPLAVFRDRSRAEAFAASTNEARDNAMRAAVGNVVVRVRTVSTTPWADVDNIIVSIAHTVTGPRGSFVGEVFADEGAARAFIRDHRLCDELILTSSVLMLTASGK